MKLIKLIIIILFFHSSTADLCYGVQGQPISPDRKHSVQEKIEDERKEIYLKTARKEPGIFLIRAERYVSVKWSDDSKFFAIENHFDGHMCALKIYQISQDLKGRVSVVNVYNSPVCDYDSFWTLDKFSLEDGTAKIRCKFTVYPDSIVTSPKADNTFIREYAVPLFPTPEIVAKSKQK